MGGRLGALALIALAGCSSERVSAVPDPSSAPTQVLATDRDPDPGVFEVDLVATTGTVDIDGIATAIWGYADGDAAPTLPGPMIVAEPGDLLVARFVNRLDDGTTVHFHGPRLPNEMDGAPVGGTIVAPGETFDYVFPLEDLGTFWYHPHWDTAEQLERGLYGQLVVREPAVPGAEERFFMLDDVDRTAEGAIDLELSEEDLRFGRMGETILVNGQATPELQLPSNALERWHFTNASNGRYFALRLPGHSFTVIGTDGGLLEEAYDAEEIVLTPGSRLDVVVALNGSPGDRIEMVTVPVDRGPSSPDETSRVVMTLALGDAGVPPGDWRSTLPLGAIEPIDVTGAPERMIQLGALAGAIGPEDPAFHINAESWPFAEPEQGVVGDVETWSVQNQTDTSEPFHLHGTFVQPLDLDGVPFPRLEREDVVNVPSGSTLRMAVRFEREGNWMFHSHILEHADQGMMRVLRLVP